MGDVLTKKVVEAGIVPTGAVRLLKMWRSLPDDTPETELEAKTQQELLGMVSEIDNLLEWEREVPELRETDLDLDRYWTGASIHKLVYQRGLHHVVAYVPAARNRTGEFVLFWAGPQMEIMVRPGSQITDMKQDVVYEVTQVTVRYVEDQPRYLVCDVQEVPKHAVLRTGSQNG